MCSLRNAALVLAGVMWLMSAAAAQEAPDRGAQIVRTRCTQCHAIDLIEEQRLGPAAWDREAAKMIGWGAAVPASEAADLSAYLAAQYGAGRRNNALPSNTAITASSLLMTRCTVCHATDLIAAQRLDAEGWRREVAKMVGWGAVLSPDEQAMVVEHLARRR